MLTMSTEYPIFCQYPKLWIKCWRRCIYNNASIYTKNKKLLNFADLGHLRSVPALICLPLPCGREALVCQHYKTEINPPDGNKRACKLLSNLFGTFISAYLEPSNFYEPSNLKIINFFKVNSPNIFLGWFSIIARN